MTDVGMATGGPMLGLGVPRALGAVSATRKALVRGGRDPFGLLRGTPDGPHRHLAFAKAHLTVPTELAARILRRA